MLWPAASAGVCEQGIQRFDSGAVRLWVEIWVENRRCRSPCKPVQHGLVVCILVPDTRCLLRPCIAGATVAPQHGPEADLARRAANSGLSLLLQGQAHIAEPRAGDPDPFPAIRGLGGCRHVGQGRVQLGPARGTTEP